MSEEEVISALLGDSDPEQCLEEGWVDINAIEDVELYRAYEKAEKAYFDLQDAIDEVYDQAERVAEEKDYTP